MKFDCIRDNERIYCTSNSGKSIWNLFITSRSDKLKGGFLQMKLMQFWELLYLCLFWSTATSENARRLCDKNFVKMKNETQKKTKYEKVHPTVSILIEMQNWYV